MDLLSKNFVIIDWNKRKVYLAGDIKIDKKLFFRGESKEIQLLLIFYAKANKYLQKWRQGILTSVVEAPKESKDIDPSSMKTVLEFLDIFAKELLGFPQDREFEFPIDLLLGTTPIS